MPFKIYITNILTEEIPYDADHESWFNEVPNIIFIVWYECKISKSISSLNFPSPISRPQTFTALWVET